MLAVGTDAGPPGLRPPRLRHTYATRLREGGADLAQIQALMVHSSLETSARCFRAGTTEQAEVVDRIFTWPCTHLGRASEHATHSTLCSPPGGSGHVSVPRVRQRAGGGRRAGATAVDRAGQAVSLWRRSPRRTSST
ncbi:tyrosine-type recombinase/integrase [Nonomuraea sp. NPDC055795]